MYCFFFFFRGGGLATLTGRAPEPCGWALCPGSVAVLRVASCPFVLVSAAPLHFVAGLCVRVLSFLGLAPDSLWGSTELVLWHTEQPWTD